MLEYSDNMTSEESLSMATITLDVPDELAERLVELRGRLPELLSVTLDLFQSQAPAAVSESVAVSPAFEEMIKFLVSGPTPDEIVAFKISPAAQARLDDLLDKNREDGLTDDELAELDGYEQIHFVLLLLKAHARPLIAPLQ